VEWESGDQATLAPAAHLHLLQVQVSAGVRLSGIGGIGIWNWGKQFLTPVLAARASVVD
jgi:hypothetical protein